MRHFALALTSLRTGSAAATAAGTATTWHECYKSNALLSISDLAVVHFSRDSVGAHVGVRTEQQYN